MNTFKTITTAAALNLLTFGVAYANPGVEDYSMEVLAPTASSYTTKASDELTYASGYSMELVLPTAHAFAKVSDERTYVEDYAMELNVPTEGNVVLVKANPNKM